MPADQQRLYSGLLFVVVALAFGVAAVRHYPLGSAASMGPGYFPLLLSGVLALLGVVALVQGLRMRAQRIEETAATPPRRFAWRPVFFVLLANAAFGLLIEGVPALGIPAGGLVVSTYAVVFIASWAGSEHRNGPALLLATGLAAGCYLVFIQAMGLVVPAWPSDLLP
ncbi:MAG: tripartite tricarboxylate transporter TctB family protein [Comamonas sp.]